MTKLMAYLRTDDGRLVGAQLFSRSLDLAVEEARAAAASTPGVEGVELVRQITQAPLMLGTRYEFRVKPNSLRLEYRVEGDPWHSFDYVTLDHSGRAVLPVEVPTAVGGHAVAFVAVDACRSVGFERAMRDRHAVFTVEGGQIACRLHDAFHRPTHSVAVENLPPRRHCRVRPSDGLDFAPEAEEARPEPGRAVGMR